MKEFILECLHSFGDFHNVPEEQLQWLASQGEVIHFGQGEMLFNVGEPVNQFYIVLDGKFRVCAVLIGQTKRTAHA